MCALIHRKYIAKTHVLICDNEYIKYIFYIRELIEYNCMSRNGYYTAIQLTSFVQSLPRTPIRYWTYPLM